LSCRREGLATESAWDTFLPILPFEAAKREQALSILEKIIRTKRTEIEKLHAETTIADWRDQANDAEPVRSFIDALRGAPPIRLIAEVKKASPSQGLIREHFDPVAIALDYQRAGASCISVLTDEQYFQGHLDYLRQVRQAIELPVLRKDFILDPIQVWQARAYGADAVLLIAECLDAGRLSLLAATIEEAGMTAFVELYDERNVEMVAALDLPLVGVNNRNLDTFQVDLQHSVRVKQKFSDRQIFVSESGIRSAADVQFLQRNGVDAILVGQSLCEQADVYAATLALIQDCPE